MLVTKTKSNDMYKMSNIQNLASRFPHTAGWKGDLWGSGISTLVAKVGKCYYDATETNLLSLLFATQIAMTTIVKNGKVNRGTGVYPL